LGKCKKTPLYEFHKEKGHIIEFAGFCMPLYYNSIIQEHLSVRNNVGLFDVSHMGRIIVEGEDALEYLNYVTANDVNKLEEGRAQYTLLLNENGGIIDDLIIYRTSDNKYLLVVNAGNREKDYKWLVNHSNNYNWEVNINNVSDKTIMFAIQGPKAHLVMENMYKESKNLRRFSFLKTVFNNRELLISRTGYTGEDGFEVILFINNKEEAIEFWELIYNYVNKLGGALCGLGARDSLRIEAGYCLYGNDIDENTNPIEADLFWVVKMYKDDFIGKAALEEILKKGISKLRIGVILESKVVPRPGYKVHSNGDEIGFVTSGTYSPILNKGVGIVYVNKEYAIEGKEVNLVIRNKTYKGILKKFPLYDPNKYGYRRKTTV